MSATESSHFTQRETSIAAERRLKFQGTVVVDLDQITFDSRSIRQIDHKNVDRLCDIFKKEECRNLAIENRVPAVISRHDLNTALEQANATSHELRNNAPSDFLHLRFATGGLRALHGRHRVQAGREILSPEYRYWAVDLYLDDLSETLEHSLIEEYSNEKPPSDGEIYWKIRQYQNDGNVYEELRCWAKLGKTKETRLRQLQKNIRLRHAFDAVLVIPGQRSALRISMIHRIVALKCDEEILHALKHIQTFWSSLVNGVLESLAKIDQHTVETLQLLAPGISRSEARNVHGLILSGQIFKEFTETERLAIYEKVIANGQCLIPSLFQFFEDFKVFECCTHSIKRLFPITQSTVRSSMSRLFKYPEGDEGDCLIQTSHSTFYSRRETKGKCFDIAYRTMWLYSMRYYTQLPPHQKNQELLAKPRNAEADDYVLYEMATLVQRVGFESRQIAELVNRNPDRLFARDVLLKARKPENYSYNPAVFTSLIDRLVECFNTAAPAQQGSSQPVLMERSVKVKARCGHPTMRTLRQDRSLLFIDQMHGEEWPQSVTTGYVRRCVYLSFFGPLSRSASQQRRDTSSGADNPDSSALTTFIPEDRTNLTSGNRPSDQQDVARDGESGDQPPHESINQEADSGPMWENLPGTDTMQETEQSEYTIDIDDMVDDILQDDANQRAIAEHDEQERRRWETEQDTTGEQEQGSQQAEMDRERAMALAQLENTADSSRGSEFTVGEQYLQQIGPDLGLSDASHRITRFDLPGMIARWREASSVLGDDEKHSSLPSAQPPNRAGEDTPKRRRNTEEDDPPQPVETAEAEQRSEDHPAQLEAGNRDHESQPAVTDGQPLDTNDLDVSNNNEGTVPSWLSKIGRPQKVESVNITFYIFERDHWRVAHVSTINVSEPSALERIVRKYRGRSVYVYDMNMRSVNISSSFKAATTNGENALLLIPPEVVERLEGRHRRIEPPCKRPRRISHNPIRQQIFGDGSLV